MSVITMFSQKSDGTFDRVRIDSEHGSFSQSEGHAEGDSLVFVWQRDLGERILGTRHYFFDFDDSSFTMAFYMSRSADDPWELVQRALYRRKQDGD